MSLLPGVFLTTGNGKVKAMSGKIEKQTLEIENLRRHLWSKKLDCDLQTSRIAALKVDVENLRAWEENKAEYLRRLVELVHSLRSEAWTRAREHQREIRELIWKNEETSEALKSKLKNLSDKETEVVKLSLKNTGLTTALEVSSREFIEEKEKNSELSSKMEAEMSKHAFELGNIKTALEMKSLEFSEQKQTSESLRNSINEKRIKIEEQASRIKQLEAESVGHTIEIKSSRAEVEVKLKELVEKTKANKFLQDDVQKKADLLRELNKKIEENALEVQKKAELLRWQEKQAVVIWRQFRQLRELEGDKQSKTKTIRELENNLKDHVKNLREQDAIIAARSEEVENLRHEIEVKSSIIRSQAGKIANLTLDLKSVTKRTESKVKAIEKIKKSDEDKCLIIIEKDENLATKDSELRELKARHVEESLRQIASQSSEIESLKKDIQIKQLELQTKVTELKYLPRLVEEQKKDTGAPGGGLKKPIKRGRQSTGRAIARRLKRFKKTEDS